MRPPGAPTPADEANTELWDGSPAAAVFALLSLLGVGILTFGLGHLFGGVIWHDRQTELGPVRAVLTLLVAFVAGPPIILLLSSAFRRLTDAWRIR